MLIGSEKPLWGEFNKLLYCIVLYCLLPYSHQADIRTRSDRFLPLKDNKSSASWHVNKTGCELIVTTFIHELAASLCMI